MESFQAEPNRNVVTAPPILGANKYSSEDTITESPLRSETKASDNTQKTPESHERQTDENTTEQAGYSPAKQGKQVHFRTIL